jgi:nitroimidazol reductase NimA-like FMN-containing flavoprotein (pyridoxamine 5'-phosphate oxidase superfamily)
LKSDDADVGSAAQFDRNGLEVLDREASLGLLATATLGRIGVTDGALPTILPVNFGFDGQRILVRTGVGTKLHAAAAGAVVAFEVDDFDPLYHSGWSVVVTGPAEEVSDPDDLAQARLAHLPHWVPADGHIIAIDPAIVSGRRIIPGRPVGDR